MGLMEQPASPADFSCYRDMRVTVMGLGQFGGGAGAVRFLAEQGAHVTVTDMRSAADLSDSISQLHDISVAAWHLGGHDAADFTETDLLVVSPAVPRTHPLIDQAIAAGIPISSEMNLFWQHNIGKVIAVTGSNGKSTTTAMTHAILQQAGQHCWLGGNIGRSLLPHVANIGPEDFVVLELSSFQLDDLSPLQQSPHVGIVTNFSPNHLDRHGSLEAYRTAKQNLLRWMSDSDWAILNFDDPDVSHWPTSGRVLGFGLRDSNVDGLFLDRQQGTHQAMFRLAGKEQLLPIPEWLPLPGSHNLQNALAASCAALCLGTLPTHIEAGLRGYQSLPHRLELVREIGDRRFFNDSLATTPESACVALTAFTEPIVLLAGGYDKGADLIPLARAIVDSTVKAVALMGQTGATLAEQIQNHDGEQRIAIHFSKDLNDAFNWSTQQSSPGDVILLSPGCASYDWFRNFAERGDQFRQLATHWTPNAGS